MYLSISPSLVCFIITYYHLNRMTGERATVLRVGDIPVLMLLIIANKQYLKKKVHLTFG